MLETHLNRQRLKIEEEKMISYLNDILVPISSLEKLMIYERRVYFETINQVFKFYDNRSFSCNFKEFKKYWESLDLILCYTIKEQYIVVVTKNKI